MDTRLDPYQIWITSREDPPAKDAADCIRRKYGLTEEQIQQLKQRAGIR